MRKITADIVYPIASPPIEQGVVVVDDEGFVRTVNRRSDHDASTLEKYAGALVPGFINTHCHLELSHMKGVAPTGTGLLPFLKTVVTYRDVAAEEIQTAIARADREMFDAGIVAVGDIANKSDTAAVKSESPIRYYTFVEMFDFMQDSMAEKTFADYKKVLEAQSAAGNNKKSAVPHAPYTVSDTLFKKINQLNSEDAVVSIHNQETAHENDLFLHKSGGFLDFYEGFGFSLDGFRPTGKTSIHNALKNMNPACKTIFVHNTTTTPEDIRAATRWSDQTYWASCPNANLYIENRLPDYRNFMDAQVRLTIGTDSLTSNWQLSVLEEIKTIARYQSYVPLSMLLRWATLNGAEALGYSDELGSFEPGKKPGVNLIENLDTHGNLSVSTTVRRLV